MPPNEQIEDIAGEREETVSRIDPDILSKIFVEDTKHSMNKIAAELEREEAPILRQALVYADFIRRTKGIEARDAFIEGVLRTIRAYNEQGSQD